MADKAPNKPNSPFEIAANAKIPSPAQPKAESPVTPKTAEKDLPPIVEKKEETKEPFYKQLKKGPHQFTAMPQTQEFKPPPETPPVANTNLPTQPRANTSQDLEQKPKKFLTPIKMILLLLLLILIGLITISATLVATDYELYEPPAPIRNLIETVISGGKN